MQTSINLSVEPAASPPSEFRIFTAGKVDTAKGTFLFDSAAAASVLAAAADQGNEIPLDYNHAMVSDARPLDKIAAGWFALSVRAGELWATNVRWTARAAKALLAKEWRYISPTFTHEAKEPRRVLSLFNVALTNTPATKHLSPLMASLAAGAAVVQLTDEQRALCAKHGVSEASYLATLQDEHAAELARKASVARESAEIENFRTTGEVSLNSADRQAMRSLGITEKTALAHKRADLTARVQGGSR